MSELTQLEDAIIELQTKLAFQDGLLEELNQVVTDQQQQIMRLEAAHQKLKGQVNTLQTDLEPGEGKEPPPPHY